MKVPLPVSKTNSLSELGYSDDDSYDKELPEPDEVFLKEVPIVILVTRTQESGDREVEATGILDDKTLSLIRRDASQDETPTLPTSRSTTDTPTHRASREETPILSISRGMSPTTVKDGWKVEVMTSHIFKPRNNLEEDVFAGNEEGRLKNKFSQFREVFAALKKQNDQNFAKAEKILITLSDNSKYILFDGVLLDSAGKNQIFDVKIFSQVREILSIKINERIRDVREDFKELFNQVAKGSKYIEGSELEKILSDPSSGRFVKCSMAAGKSPAIVQSKPIPEYVEYRPGDGPFSFFSEQGEQQSQSAASRRVKSPQPESVGSVKIDKETGVINLTNPDHGNDHNVMKAMLSWIGKYADKVNKGVKKEGGSRPSSATQSIQVSQAESRQEGSALGL